MASVWISQPSGCTKLDGHLSDMGAVLRMTERANIWRVNDIKRRSIAQISNLEWHLIENGKPVAHLYIEPCSPPTLPAGGDRYRANRKAA